MPIYMDRHNVSEKVTAEHVALLHQQDLKIQHQFNCRGLTYWFDERRRMAFCLIEAPNKEAIQQMHDQAHGEVPHQIIEVDPGVVESFLGRIKDPHPKNEEGLNIIDDPAYRVIMISGFEDCIHLREYFGKRNIELQGALQTMNQDFIRFEGRVVKQVRNYFLVSFSSLLQALLCAIEINSKYADWSDQMGCPNIYLKTGISAGVPVHENKPIFEDTVSSAERLFYISSSNILISSEVRKLYHEENLDVQLDPELFVVLTLSDEKFLNHLMTFLEETWRNPDLQVEDLGSHIGYSKSQVYRKMMSLTGKSPNNFIKDYR
ncbi:MAG TPA: nickel-binding protein, partial [Sunxiuqinia sp.]|nr:nickel-binding protein [Sunxiuqinia sp.]